MNYHTQRTDSRPDLLRTLRQHNHKWFSPENERIFGDKEYIGAYGKKTGERYLLQLTNCWSDMCGGKSVDRWRIHMIDEHFKIGNLLDVELADWNEVKQWLKAN